jgi:hypothetical protein
MSFVATAIVGTAAVGAIGARSAAKAQVRAGEQAVDSNERVAQMQIDAQKEMFDKQNRLQQPYRSAGEYGLSQIRNGMSTGGQFTKQFGMKDYEADPGYAFRLTEGLKGINANAAARGGLISGNALKAAARYGQQMGSEEYQNAFNRYQVNRSNQLNPLMSLAGIGQTATNVLGNAASQQGAGISSALGQMGQSNANAYGDMGNARASGYVGMGNALNSAVGTGLNFYQGNQMVNALNRR